MNPFTSTVFYALMYFHEKYKFSSLLCTFLKYSSHYLELETVILSEGESDDVTVLICMFV